MLTKNVVLLCLITFSLGGCISSKSYVDPKYGGVDYSEIKSVEKQHSVNIDIEFQRNGEHLAAVDGELRSNVERIFRASGVVVPTNEETDLSIKVVCNNIADLAAARAKGFGTGLTFGAAGSAVVDYYEVIIVFKQGSEVVEKKYDHAIHTTVGNKAAPVQGVEATSLGNAFSGVVEDVILQFIKEMQANDILTLNDLLLIKSA